MHVAPSTRKVTRFPLLLLHEELHGSLAAEAGCGAQCSARIHPLHYPSRRAWYQNARTLWRNRGHYSRRLYHRNLRSQHA